MCVCIYTSKLNLFVMFYALNSIANISNSPFCGCFFGFGVYIYIYTHTHTQTYIIYICICIYIFAYLFCILGGCDLFLSVSLISCV